MAEADKPHRVKSDMWALSGTFLSAAPLRVAVVGVGGSGSEVVSNLVHVDLALRVHGYGGLHVIAFDPDVVSEANVVRQRYTIADIGNSKAETLISRVNLACSLDWEAVPAAFKREAGRGTWDIVISCVDTRKARKQLHGYAFADRFGVWRFWLDLGNTATSGQAILGTPRGKSRALAYALPCATELHPELMDTHVVDDEAPSCSALDAIARQDLFVNKMVALLGTNLLWRLLKDGKLSEHAVYFDLERYAISPAAAPKKPKRRPAQDR